MEEEAPTSPIHDADADVEMGSDNLASQKGEAMVESDVRDLATCAKIRD